jgi:hypothetical protein
MTPLRRRCASPSGVPSGRRPSGPEGRSPVSGSDVAGVSAKFLIAQHFTSQMVRYANNFPSTRYVPSLTGKVFS